MILTPAQQDALTEIANIGASKAAKQLSALLRDNVVMNVPRVVMGTFKDMPWLAEVDPSEDISAVYQKTDGLLRANVALLLHAQESRRLVQALFELDPSQDPDTLRALENEAMTEVGNIIISASMAAIANLIGGQIQLSVPAYTEGSFERISSEIDRAMTNSDLHVLVINSRLHAARRQVTGSLVITLSLKDMTLFIRSVDAWLARLNNAQPHS